MNEEKIIQLYDLVLNVQQLSYNNLLSVGFSEKEIQEFMNIGLICLDRSNIKFNDIEGLYKYGEDLLSRGQTLKAYKCFKYCNNFPKEFKGKCFEMLIYSLKRKNMFLASKNFDMFCEMEPKISEQDRNLYLYLIGYVGEFSEEHKQLISNMIFNDVELVDLKSEILHDENPIRELIFEDNLVLAINKLKKLERINNREYIISLLAVAIKAEYELDNKVLQLIIEHNYEEVKNILLDIKSKRYLKTRQIYILIIVEAILKLQNNEEIIETKCEKDNDFYLLLRSNNFASALQLRSFKLSEKNINRENDAVYMLLLDINAMMIEKSEVDMSRSRIKSADE